MSEKDLHLKVATRRLYWSMGMTTRLNVKLRTHITSNASGTRSRTEEFTDLDVLGIGQSPAGKIVTSIGDCKTVKKQANERCFWLRGVADFFDASTAHLVRSYDVPVSTRQLAERLSLGVMTEGDLQAMQGWYQQSFSPEISALFDPTAVARHQQSTTNLDPKLNRLTDYRDFGYWIVEPHRTIDGVIHHLNLVRQDLDPRNPLHRSLVLDMTWLFCLSLSRSASHIRDTYASNLDLALTQYIFGGPSGHRDKLSQATLLNRILPNRVEGAQVEIRPSYFPGLLETVTRHLRRPHLVVDILRYSEWLSFAASEKSLSDIPIATVYGDGYQEIAGKLLGDTVKFLLGAARLNDRFTDLIELTSPFASKISLPSQTQGMFTDSNPAVTIPESLI